MTTFPSATADTDLEMLRSWIGRTSESSDVITRGLVSRLDATLSALVEDRPDPDSAPGLIHLCLNLPDAPTSALGEDGHPERGGFLPPVPLPRRMWAGGKFAFHRDLRVGDQVDRHSRVADVSLKEGRTGALCFVTVEHRHSVGGDLAIEERQDIVYRGVETGGPPAPAEPGPAGAEQYPVPLGPALLFRYSALTFNSHRIHYDRPYATEVEHYPGLVVHGPLQATLLHRFARRLRGAAPKTFSFRGVGPLIDHDGLVLNAAAGAAGPLQLWTSSSDGRIAMKAEAAW